MKKIIYVAASSALVLSSCSNDIDDASLVAMKSRQEIKFETYTPGITRATVADASAVNKNGFWMYATNNDTVLINDPYRLENRVWVRASEGDAYQWPDDAVNFYGIYTAGSEPTITEGNLVLSEINGNTDVMVAAAENLTLFENGQKVSLAFNHILADVEIQMIGDRAPYIYNVSEVKLVGMTGGSYSLSDKEFVVAESDSTSFTLFSVEQTEEVLSLSSEAVTTIGESKMLAPSDSAILYVTYEIKANETTVVNAMQTKRAVIKGIAAGKKNTVKVTLKPGKLPIVISTDVNAWGAKNTPTDGIEL